MRFYAQKLMLVASKSLLVLLVVAPVLVMGVGHNLLGGRAAAATSNTINFQARLMNAAGAIAADGDYNVEFKIYDTASSGGTAQGVCTGNCKWVETRTSTDKVHVANGYLSVSLGSVTAFGSTINWDQQLWVTMNIGGTGSPTWDGEMTPRLKMTAVPYAFSAGKLSTVATNSAVLQFAGSYGQATTITLPDPGGAGTASVCYQGASACGFATGTAGSYIQNGTTVQDPANFNIRSSAVGNVTGVLQGANGQTADILQVQSWNGTTATSLFAISKDGVATLAGGQTIDVTTPASTGTVNGLTLQPGVSSATTTTGGAISVRGGNVSGTTTVTGGLVTIQGGNATGGSGTRNGGGVTIDGGTGASANGTINVGTANAPTINIGSVGTTVKGTDIHIGDTSDVTNAQTVTIGSAAANTSNITLIQGGSSNTATPAIQLIPNTAGGIVIGSTTGTGGITIGRSNATNTVQLAASQPAAGKTQTLSLGNSAQTVAGNIVVNILSGSGSTAGTSSLNIANNNTVTQVDLGNVAAAAARTLNLFTGSNIVGADTINIGTGATTVASGKVIHIGDGTPTGSGTNVITLGSIAATANSTTIQGGNGSGAVSVQAAASGTINIGTVNSNQVTVGGASSNVIVGNLGAANANAIAVCRDSSTGSLIACGSGTANGTPFLQGGNSFGTTGVLGTKDNNSLQVITGTGSVVRATFDTSNNLYLGNGVTATTPNDFVVQGTGGASGNTTGGKLTVNGGTGIGTGLGGGVTIQGGGSGTGAAAAGGAVLVQGGTSNGASGVSNGGTVTIQGGTAGTGGTKGLIQLNGSTYFTTGTYSSGSISTITQATVDSFSAILATATAGSLTFTVPSPTVTTSGRVLYVTNAGSNAFVLSFSGNNLTLNPNATATLMWNGGSTNVWTSAGVDAGTLQNAYTNSAGNNTPEILVDSTPRKGLDIQDANTTIGSTEGLLSVRASATATTLGTQLFVVNASGKVGINLVSGTNNTAPTISNDLSFGQVAGATTARTIGVETQSTTNIGGNGLSLTAGTGNGTGAGGQLSIQGGGTGTGASATGGAVLIQGGTSSGASGTSNGGTVTLQGGTAGTGGTKGLIQLNGSTYFTSGSYSSGSTSTITQSLIDSNSSIMAIATASGRTFTVPAPTVQNTAGRVLYITNNGATNSFILSFGTTSLTLNIGSTATLIWQWDGSTGSWTSAGVDAGTLQNGYNNSSNSSTTPEILLDSSHAGLDIQDTVAGLGSTVPLLAVRSGASGALGSALFVVENNAGAPLVGIGTATASRALDISVNNSTVNALPLIIQQAGTGDTGIEFKTPGKNFYAGVDGTDGQFKISSPATASGITFTSMGQTGPPTLAQPDNNTNGTSASPVVASASGTLSSISVYIATVDTSLPLIQTSIYANKTSSCASGNNPCPGNLIASGTPQPAVAGVMNTISMAGTTITSGTTYWIGVSLNGAGTQYTFTGGGGGTIHYDTNAVPLGYPAQNIFDDNGVDTNRVVDMYMTIVSGAVTDNFSGSLMRISDTGQTVFQNATNSTSAFKVQNAAGTTLLGIDTTTPAINVGITGTTTQASTVNLATGTGATQTVNIGSSTTNTAAAGTTVLMQGGSTATAVSIQALAGGTIGIGTNNAGNTIQIGSTTLNGAATQTINIGNNNTASSTTNITIGNGTNATGGTTALQAKTAVTVTTNGVLRATFDNTNTVYFGNGVTAAAPNDFTVQGTGGLSGNLTGGKITVAGGTASGTGTGGAVTIQGGAAAATAGSTGGAVNINSANGTSTGTGGAAGNIILDAGNAGGSGNNAGGNVIAQLGAATGTGAQGTFQVQNALGASLLTVDPSNTAASLNLINNGGAETGSPPTSWAAQGTGSSVATGTGTDAASGSQSAKVTFGTSANAGTKVTFATAPTASTTVNYIVSFSVKQVSGTAVAPGNSALQVLYSPDNGTTLTATCSNYSSSASLSTTAWTKVSCTFIPGSTTVTTALLIIRQADTPGVSRVIDIDNLSVVQQNSSGTSNVGDLKVGGAVSQGLTLFTLDTYAANPFTGANASLAGSMYYDTTAAKIQCYDGTTWGACGAAPNSIITLSPEFTGAVLHGTPATGSASDNNIGTLTSDFCSDFLDINDATHGTSICGSNETFNFYRWTSPQATAQTYDVYITYQLPSTFKNFISGQTTMLGRTDSANSTVTYAVYKNVTGTGLTLCSATKTISTGVQTTWQTATPTTDLSTCSFAANNSIVVKVEVTASNNANAYVGTLNFQYSNQ